MLEQITCNRKKGRKQTFLSETMQLSVPVGRTHNQNGELGWWWVSALLLAGRGIVGQVTFPMTVVPSSLGSVALAASFL